MLDPDQFHIGMTEGELKWCLCLAAFGGLMLLSVHRFLRSRSAPNFICGLATCNTALGTVLPSDQRVHALKHAADLVCEIPCEGPEQKHFRQAFQRCPHEMTAPSRSMYSVM
ncbi:hypothetical protein Y696_11195 [Mesotoga sp. H07pep.5.4]|nr:hypothetical protein Y696_11195 [Mesotoga sp. H07pep.5.4]